MNFRYLATYGEGHISLNGRSVFVFRSTYISLKQEKELYESKDTKQTKGTWPHVDPPGRDCQSWFDPAQVYNLLYVEGKDRVKVLIF